MTINLHMKREEKMKHKRDKFLFLLMCVLFVASGIQNTVYAEEAYREDAEIRIQVKATVPEDFVEPVSIKYEGKNREDNELDIILDYEHEYMTVVTIPRDLYTLKHNSTAQGYKADCMSAFSVENAEADHTYWLPVTINTDRASDREENGMLNLLVRADIQTEDYDGSDITVRYSGTHGNLIIADLNAENGYQTVVQMMKDIYTKEAVEVSEGYHTVVQYSFDVSRAGAENYLLDVIVRKGAMMEEADVEEVRIPTETEDSIKEIETDKEEEAENGSQKIVFEITNAKKRNLKGNVYVSYAGKEHVIETILNEENQYSMTVDAPYDVYELLYIICYEDENQVFQPSHAVIVADGQEVMIPVRIFVEGSGRKELKRIVVVAVVIFLGILICLMMKKWKRKGKRKKEMEAEKDDFDESLYVDDEFEQDDMELNLDDE